MYQPTSVRISPDAIKRVDRIAAHLTKQAAGLHVGRTRTLQLAIDKGLVVLEAELGMAPKQKPKR